MRWFFLILVGLLFFTNAYAGTEPTYDSLLQRIIQDFDLRPLPTKPFEETNKFKLGRALFFDPISSGNRDISCATCHLLRRGTSDALNFSIGTGGIELGEERSLPQDLPQQPRNALDLWNRDNNWVTSMFWDGRVEVLDHHVFRSPMGSLLPPGFDNVMAVQAIFPMAREDEMLGKAGDRSGANLNSPHDNQENELADLTEKLSGAEKIKKVSELIMNRLLGAGGRSDQPWQLIYRELFMAAYPHLEIDQMTIVQAANALAHFEEVAFATRETPWDEYLEGNASAISDEAKHGAFLFFGKARCAVCHKGPLFSDFDFHSIGVRNNGPGIDNSGVDLGRFIVTGDNSDMYKFRTPPLRNVTLTSPYFHNGSAGTLEEVIFQHLSPFFYADKYEESGRFTMDTDHIQSISPVLAPGIRMSDQDIGDLIDFLAVLEDTGLKNENKIIPDSVPSGLSVSRID